MKPERFSPRIYGVLVRGGKVLLTRSRFTAPVLQGGRRVRPQFVNFPGGGVEVGEGPRRALLREYKEETGLRVRPVRLLYASEGAHLSTWLPIQIVSLYWLVRPSTGRLRRGGNGDDVLRLFWAPFDRVPTGEMFPSDLEFARRLPALLSPRERAA